MNLSMAGAKTAETADPAALIVRKTGDWWQDDRRNWCAYCGVALSRKDSALEKPTRDHIISRMHKGRHVTIPSCRPCNTNKGKYGLPEFMLSKYFVTVRQAKRPNQWSLRDLWLVMAMAAVEQARSNAASWPATSGRLPSKR